MSKPVRKNVPKYCFHKTSGRAYVRIRGRVCWCGKYGTDESKEKYGRLIAELAADPGAKAGIPPGSTTVVELADAYWQFCQGYYQKNGTPSGWLKHIHLTLHTHLCGPYGRTRADEFGPKAFKAIRQTLIEAGHSRPYINKLMPIVTRCFKWGGAEEVVSPNVYAALRTVEGLRKGRTTAPEPPPVLPVDAVLVDATLPSLPHVVADMVRFQRLTGCRPGEVCQLRPMDVDRGGEVWSYRPASHKTEHHGRERTIYIGPQAQAVIRPYLLREETAHCFSPAESEAKRHQEMRAMRKSKVQPSQRNRRKARRLRAPATHYTKDSYARAVRRAIDKANKAILEDAKQAAAEEARNKEIDKANKAILQDAKEFQIDSPALLAYWAPNRLRHTRATQVRKQFGLEAAQVVLGHSKADVTQVYAERDQALAVSVMKAIG